MITGQDVRHWRQQTGISLRQLSRLLHVHHITIYRWEHGRYAIAPRWQIRLAVLCHEMARRQPRLPATEVCKHCGGSGREPITP